MYWFKEELSVIGKALNGVQAGFPGERTLRVHGVIKKCPWEPCLGKKIDWKEEEAMMQAELNPCPTTQGTLG